jgi:hypothetical protein
MPNGKRKRRARGRRERAREEMPACVAWAVREITPLLHRFKPPRRRSTRHLRNATIEVLEAVRALLDETIVRLRREGRASSELKRIRVEG